MWSIESTALPSLAIELIAEKSYRIADRNKRKSSRLRAGLTQKNATLLSLNNVSSLRLLATRSRGPDSSLSKAKCSIVQFNDSITTSDFQNVNRSKRTPTYILLLMLGTTAGFAIKMFICSTLGRITEAALRELVLEVEDCLPPPLKQIDRRKHPSESLSLHHSHSLGTSHQPTQENGISYIG